MAFEHQKACNKLPECLTSGQALSVKFLIRLSPERGPRCLTKEQQPISRVTSPVRSDSGTKSEMAWQLSIFRLLREVQHSRGCKFDMDLHEDQERHV